MTTIQDIKTYTLRCAYLGESSEITGQTSEELTYSSAYIDVDSDIAKWSGDEMVTAFNNHETNPLHWHNGEAEERGILDCGLSATGWNEDSFKFCNECLERGGKKLLVMLNEDGEPCEADDVDWQMTLSRGEDTVNKNSLELLDVAHWEVEEDGYDEKALLEIIKDNETIRDADEELAIAVIEIAEKNGLVHLATWSESEDSGYKIDLHGAYGAWTEVLVDISGVYSAHFEARDYNDYYAVDCVYYFCKESDLERVVADFEDSEPIFCARIEEDYKTEGMGHEKELESEDDFEAFQTGDDTGYVIFEGTVYCKANRDGDGDWRLYERNDNDGTWTEA